MATRKLKLTHVACTHITTGQCCGEGSNRRYPRWATSPAEPLQGFPSTPPGRRSEPHQQGTVLPPEGDSPVKALPARPRPSPHLPDSQVSRGPTPPVGAAVSSSSFPSLVTAATFPSAGKDQGCFRDFQSLQTRMICKVLPAHFLLYISGLQLLWSYTTWEIA